MDEEYLEAVLDLVALIPSARAMTYGAIAEVVGDQLAATGSGRRGGPRQVGQVLARAGGGVPWWRVVAADGRPPAHHAHAARDRWSAEGTAMTADGLRVRLPVAIWFPDADSPGHVWP